MAALSVLTLPTPFLVAMSGHGPGGGPLDDCPDFSDVDRRAGLPARFTALTSEAVGHALTEAGPFVPIAFSSEIVSDTEPSKEPTLGYAPDGTVYYSGFEAADGHLWKRASAANWEVVPTPTRNGLDATVSHDGTRLFWADQHPLSVSVKNGGWGTNHTFLFGDRPWFQHNAGITHLMMYTSVGVPPVAYAMEFTYNAGEDCWHQVGPGAAESWRFADFVIASDGTAAAILRTLSAPLKWGIAVRPAGGAWHAPQILEPPGGAFGLDASFGLPRVAADDGNNIYAIFSGTLDPPTGDDSLGLWLARVTASSVTYLGMVNDPTHTGALGAIVGGSSGRLGAAWYDTPRRVLPWDAEPADVWDLRYAVLDVAGASAVVLESVPVEHAARGAIDEPTIPADPSEFIFLALQPGHPTKYVDIAWSRNYDGCEPCPEPRFSRQNQGLGLAAGQGPVIHPSDRRLLEMIQGG